MTSYQVVLVFTILQLVFSSVEAQCSQAQADYDKQLFEMSLEELISLPVFVATRTPEVGAQAPSSVTVFTRTEIEALGVDSVEALLNFVPGFITARESVFGDGSMVAARGRTTAQASYNILFLRNGQRLNNSRSGGAMTVHRMISLQDVERVEVIRGPGSALYGASAFSGVVNIVTLEDDNRIHAATSSLGGGDAYANLSTSGDDWGIRLSARGFRDNGQDYPGAHNSERKGIRDPRSGKDLFASGCYRGLDLSLHHTQRRQDDFYSVAGTLGESTDFEDTWLRTEYRLLNENSRQLDLYASYRVQQGTEIQELLTSKEILELPPALNPEGAEFPLYRKLSTREEEWALGLAGYVRANDWHELSVGLDWVRPDHIQERSVHNYEPSDGFDRQITAYDYPIYYVGDEGVVRLQPSGSDREIFSAYLQDQITIDTQWSATLGIRYDRYSDFGGHLSPRLALIHDRDASHTFKLLYGEAFRAPAIRQVSGGAVGNPSLQPELSKTMEFAWLHRSDQINTTLT
jgi:iron complex outermembrane receptor protein